MNQYQRGIKRLLKVSSAGNIVTPDRRSIVLRSGGAAASVSEDQALKLSAVYRCVEVISDSIGKLPIYVFDRNTKKRISDHPVLNMLTVRPNINQTPMDFKKQLEANRLCGGNGYAWIRRAPDGLAEQVIPIPYSSVELSRDSKTGKIYYAFRHPWEERELSRVPSEDMIHVKNYSADGLKGVSVLSRASEVIATGQASQQYSRAYYENGGQPSGVLQTDTDLSGTIERMTADGSTETISKKDLIREEWQKRYSGPTNANQVAVLDFGLKYTPISITNRDAQFVEQTAITVEDIARFFGVPLYKLQAGKQSYSSNEQNAIEYVVGTLHPIVERYEQELTYKLLTDSEIKSGLRIRINMLAELKGDTTSRAAWYRTLREISALSANDIRDLEDMENIEGGDEYYASLNYVPLSSWARLSEQRNESKQTGGT